jgi:hypothetical protein
MAFQSFGRLGRKEPMDNQLLVVAANAAVTFITVALGAATAPLLARLLPPEEALAPAPTALSVLSLDDGVRWAAAAGLGAAAAVHDGPCCCRLSDCCLPSRQGRLQQWLLQGPGSNGGPLGLPLPPAAPRC